MIGDKTVVKFTYRNHREEVGWRTVRPIKIWFGSTAYHPEAQWHLEAFDLNRMATRDFALNRIMSPWEVLFGEPIQIARSITSYDKVPKE